MSYRYHLTPLFPTISFERDKNAYADREIFETILKYIKNEQIINFVTNDLELLTRVLQLNKGKDYYLQVFSGDEFVEHLKGSVINSPEFLIGHPNFREC